MSPRLVQVSLPLTDDEKPIRLALWRATDRSYKQASEALTRVRNQCRREGTGRKPRSRFLEGRQGGLHRLTGGLLARYTRMGSAPAPCLGGVRRGSVRAPQPGFAVGGIRQPLLRQQRRLANRDRRHRRPYLHPGRDEGRRWRSFRSIRATSPRRPTDCRTRRSFWPMRAR